MSQFLTGLAQLNPQVKRHNGGTSTLTLDQSGTTNATLLFVNGVAQTPGTDFNVSGATLTTTSALPAGTNIATTIQYFNTGIVNAPADNSVTGAKLDVSLVQGDVLTATGTDTLARLAKGTANQKLSMNSAANAVEWQTVASSGWAFVQEIAISSASTIDAEGWAAGYDYKVVGYGLDLAADGNDTRVLFGTGATPTYQTSGYYWVATGGGGTGSGTNSGANVGYGQLNHSSFGGASDPEEIAFDITVYNPADSGNKTFGQFIAGSLTAGGAMASYVGTFFRSTDEAVTALRIYPVSSNFTTGKVYVYRRPNA
jgi:hypothetical protein